ncbi:MAG: phosphatase PAP2 family protein [Cryomorphaceae bacterium]|nr:phosphatase PAP2 family protein [Cryomorphaceae bacterium]
MFQFNIIIYVLIAICCSTSAPLSAQEGMIKTSKGFKWTLTGSSATLAGTAFLMSRNDKGMSAVEVGNLRSSSINAIDKRFVNSYYHGAALASDFVAIGSGILPACAFLFPAARKDLSELAHMYAEVSFLNYAFATSTKSLVQRPRPFTYNTSVLLDEKLLPDARRSFYSMHTSTTASYCFFTAMMVQQYSDKKWVKTSTWIAAAVAPMVTGLLRVRGGQHFVTDVATGYLIGAAVGIGVPYLHLKKARKSTH